jgi:voltage-gated potassium channel
LQNFLIGVVNRESGNQLHFAIGEKEHCLDAWDVLVAMGGLQGEKIV